MKKRLIYSSLLILAISTQIMGASKYTLGVNKFMRKDYDEAKGLLQEAVVENSKNGNAYYYLGEIEKNRRNYSEAIAYYLKALDNNVSSKYRKLTYWNLIILTEQKNDLRGLVKTCRIFYEKTGDISAKKKVDSLINKMLWSSKQDAVEEFQKGKEYMSTSETESAIYHFNNAISKDSSFLAPRFELGMIYYKNGEIDKSVQHLHIIADKIPFYTEVQQLLGKVYLQNNAYSNAVEYYTNVLEYGFITKSETYDAYFGRGQAYYKMKQYSKAESDITKALAIKNISSPKFVLSAIYIKQKKYDEAITALNQLQKEYPYNPDVKYQLGSVYYKKNDLNYIKYFEELYKLLGAKKDLPEKYFKAYTLLADHYYQKMAYTKSAAILTALPEEKLNYNQKINAATSLYYSGKNRESIEYFEKLSLTDNSKIVLAKAYTKYGAKIKAKETVLGLMKSSTYKEKLLSDEVLGPVAQQIVAEEKASELAAQKAAAEAAAKSLKPIESLDADKDSSQSSQ